MKRTSIRKRLIAGDAVIGSWVQIPHPAVARILGTSGLDWLAVDGEHGMVDAAMCDQLLLTIASHGCSPIVRLPGNAYASNKRFLDAGAEGLIAPLIRTAEEAKRFVESAKYPPDGLRGVGFCPANLYGKHLQEYIANANENTLCCVQIEHHEAITNLESILSVPGVDATFIGPYDLSASLGVAGQFDHPDYKKALETFVHTCHRMKIPAGIHVIQPNGDEVLKRIEEGYRFIAFSLDVTMILNAVTDGMARIKAGRKAKGA